ncbi:MAG: serine protease [candidate division Zixibacteria bacterium]|nr:serine protease [candidate division Zixibacteria bacterium]MDH3936382.1 serine protease [candidate division Zixibacteria bacterium]MDH4032213.1 serine protease [candidate division Zixibacteria bacterium]
MIDFREGVSKIEASVFGIGDHDGPQFNIFGTGFVIHEDGWILTNKHVLEPLLRTDDEGNVSIRPESRALNFVVMDGEDSTFPQIGFANTRIKDLRWIDDPPASNPVNARDSVDFEGQRADLVLPPAAPDIGICRMDLTEPPFDSIALRPVKIVLSDNLHVGTPVGILGFPQGLDGPVVDTIADLQCCPILQTGCLAGILPHPKLAIQTQLLLDIYINGGSSGSPVFTVDGDVVGVVFASRIEFTPMVELLENQDEREHERFGVHQETSLGCAVPTSAFSKQLNELLPGLIDIPEEGKSVG